MGGDEDGRADIPQEDLNLLRGILVSSLSRENLGPVDLSPPVPAPRRNRKVTFLDPDLRVAHDSSLDGKFQLIIIFRSIE
ncbi:Hypothetical protein NTJ_05803 [Nesidiocoris tenuis]|uniref:Uncharacterized protein n=1 Tax=Nesidiocoris tenuis TaxID=355587 RepID=A0ABN7ALA1_9HEMI|nr:Hypothetical protein NTJ_05803 [Nesidiocoris tenuis]